MQKRRLGPISLEFVVWILYGVENYEKVRGELSNETPETWKNNIRTSPKAHPVAEHWVDRMDKDLNPGSALLELTKLIKNKLLVPLYDQMEDQGSDGMVTPKAIRATAQILVNELTNIRNKFESQEWEKSKACQLVKKRKTSKKAGQESKDNNRTHQVGHLSQNGFRFGIVTDYGVVVRKWDLRGVEISSTPHGSVTNEFSVRVRFSTDGAMTWLMPRQGTYRCSLVGTHFGQ